MTEKPNSIPAIPTIYIQPDHGWAPLQLKEFWEYRELLYFLVWRDIKVRYKQTVLGAAWAILQPFLTMVVFSLFFGKLVRGEVPPGGPEDVGRAAALARARKFGGDFVAACRAALAA